jgi:RNA polymerase sigma factor (sigma-70 family)
MNPSFDIGSLVPAADWQAEKMHILRDATSSSADQSEATAQICTALEPYLHQIARAWWKRFRHVHGHAGMEDIESAGRHGLLLALKKWRPDFQKPLIHLASRCIAEACKTEAIRLSQGACELPFKVRRLCTKYRHLRDTGTTEERMSLLSGSHSRRSTLHIVRYFGQSDSDGGLSLDISPTLDRSINPAIRNLKADQISPPEFAERSEDMETIRTVLLGECSPRERLIFYLRFPNDPLALCEVGNVVNKRGDLIEPILENGRLVSGRFCEIAELLGLTRERIRQLNNGLFTKLRTKLSIGASADAGESHRSVA